MVAIKLKEARESAVWTKTELNVIEGVVNNAEKGERILDKWYQLILDKTKPKFKHK